MTPERAHDLAMAQLTLRQLHDAASPSRREAVILALIRHLRKEAKAGRLLAYDPK